MPVTIPSGYEAVETPIRRVRRAPYVTDDKHWTIHQRLRVEMETGIGLSAGQGSDPFVILRCSDDGGHTFGPEHWKRAGKIGMYKARAFWVRLGRSRQRVYEIAMTDPVKAVIVGADLLVSRGQH